MAGFPGQISISGWQTTPPGGKSGAGGRFEEFWESARKVQCQSTSRFCFSEKWG